MVRHLQELLQNQSERKPESQELIEREVKFFVKHKEHLHYQAMEKAGAPRGSGAIESLGKQLQQRLRGCGQIWGRPGFTRLLKVVVLVKNQDDHLLPRPVLASVSCRARNSGLELTFTRC